MDSLILMQELDAWHVMTANPAITGERLKGESPMSKANEVDGVVKCQQTVKVVHSEVLREIVEQAHMAGQSDAGVDPSYSTAIATHATRQTL
jgi:hypothetical protein